MWQFENRAQLVAGQRSDVVEALKRSTDAPVK
jgi:hypothetical protein